MPAADTHDSGIEDNEMGGGDGNASPAGSAAPGKPESASPFVYDPLAPEPGTPASPVPSATPAPDAPEDDSTVGTGTSIALGCIAGSVFLIIIAILILFLVSVFAG